MFLFKSFFVTILIGSPLFAGPIELVVDQSQSSAATELCLTIISTACDADASSVAGTISVSLDCPPSPGEVTLHDFALQMLDDVDFLLDYGVSGQFIATGRNIRLNYADPGNPLPPAALIADAFTYADVPAVAEGQLDYDTTGSLCFIFQLGGYACADTIDLGMITLDPLTVDGTLVVSGSDVTAELHVDISGPIDPDNPDLGTITIDTTIVAFGTIPTPCCPGDLTGDDRVNLDDHGKLLGCLVGPGGGAPGACQCADLDSSNSVDLRDIAEFQMLFEGS